MSLTLSFDPAFSLRRDGAPISLTNKKAQALLVYLALTGQPQSREHLATLLWGDRLDDQARNSLRQALFALRKAVGVEVVTGDDPLSLAEGALGVEQIGAASSGFRIRAEAFDGWFEEQCAARRGDQAAELAAEAERDGSVTGWRQALALDPVNETFQRGLMRAMAADGRRADALASYNRFAERLSAELDASPSPETAALAKDLRLGTEIAANAAPSYEGPGEVVKAHALIAPFSDLGGGDLAQFFANELPLEIGFRTQAIKLVAIVPAEHLNTASPDTAALMREAKERGAESLIIGSARQIGDNVRVAARVLSVSDGAVTWSDTLVVSEADAFDAIGRFATTVAQALARHAGGFRSIDDAIDRLKSLIDDPPAFHTALQNFIWYGFFIQQIRSNQERFHEIVSIAVEHFPDSPDCLAWKGYADFHWAHLGDVTDRTTNYAKAKVWVDRALALDPEHSLALGGRIFTSTWLGDFAAADAAHDKLVAIESPLHVRAGLYSASLVFRGRLQEALPLLTRAIELERGTPLLFYRYSILGLGHFLAGDHAAALVAADDALAVGKEFFLAHLVRIAALQRIGRENDAARAVEDMRANFKAPRVSDYEFLPIVDQAARTSFMTALREAGMPD